MLKACVLVGLDWGEPMMFLLLHVTCSCIFHTYVLIFFLLIDIKCVWYFSVCFSLSSFQLVALWHLNISTLRPKTLFILGCLLLFPLLILHPLTFSSMMQLTKRKREGERETRRKAPNTSIYKNKKNKGTYA